jgi:hypothetical protein
MTKAGVPKAKCGAGMGISMGNSVQMDTAICSMVINNGYGGIIQWAISENGLAPANMTAIAKFVALPTAVQAGIAAQYASPLSLFIKRNGTTGLSEICYTVPSSSINANVNIGVYDIRGALVKTLVHGQSNSGVYTIPFGQNAPGTYLIKLTTGSKTEATKAFIVK